MLTLNPSTIPPVILSSDELAAMFKSEDPPVIAVMKKVLSMDAEENAILRIYLSRSDSTSELFSPGTLFAICQIKTAKTQVVIDCLLSEDYEPLEPFWYSEYCEQMINTHRALLHREIMFLVSQTNTILTSS